jgi:phage baseplate assembly protein W
MVDTVLNQPIVGVGLPAIRLTGYFASKNQYDVAWSDLMMTLFCPIGGRAMSRSFGSALVQSLFNPVTVVNANFLTYIIQQAALTWCPHVQVLQVQSQQNGGSISLLITFSLTANQASPQQRSVLIPDTAIVRYLAQPQA